jgi:hypothetical protein
MFKKLFFVIIVSMVVTFLIAFGAPKQKVYAEAKDNLAKSSVGVLAGWSEVAVYPMQQASKPGLLGKVLFPINIGVGAVKAAVRTGVGAIDFVTFYKGENVVNSWPGEEL